MGLARRSAVSGWAGASSPRSRGTRERAGVHTLRLETNRRAHRGDRDLPHDGYREVAAFNDEPYAQHWFAKTL